MSKASRERQRKREPVLPDRRAVTVKMTEEFAAAMKEQLAAFKKKFGREPGPEDPIFFDPDADTPQPIAEDVIARQVSDAMSLAGIDPAKIYAWKRTGMFVTEENLDKWSRADLVEYRNAMDSYRRAHPEVAR